MNDPTTWDAFAIAHATALAGRADGVGVLGAGIAGVDLDGCRDATTGALDPSALGIDAP